MKFKCFTLALLLNSAVIGSAFAFSPLKIDNKPIENQSYVLPVLQVSDNKVETVLDKVADGAREGTAKAAAAMSNVVENATDGIQSLVGNRNEEQREVPQVTVDNLIISGAVIAASLPNQPNGAGYLMIQNNGLERDTLLTGAASFASEVEIHEMRMEGDVMIMRPVGDGLPIPAGETVDLAPGGYHLMFMDLRAPLVVGQDLPVMLTFRKAGSVVIDMRVESIKESMAKHDK